MNDTGPAIIYRVQGADGRGPWRPGLSKHWTDPDRTFLPAGIVEAFGLDWRDEIQASWACGCACRSPEALMKWFTDSERERLAQIGFMPVAMYAERVIRENADQLIFARRYPLKVGAVVFQWGTVPAEKHLAMLRHPQNWKAA